jgi:hypothetical protein
MEALPDSATYDWRIFSSTEDYSPLFNKQHRGTARLAISETGSNRFIHSIFREFGLIVLPISRSWHGFLYYRSR